eukprot:gnl/TRDRNA2_/TRDRNA2_43666_c0_seq1.p1 gnl/TRDRNA2_/TRDRNA2_43666_c0~~gnl/TRDRNA2_/TRDRNA2_43666_c0_seq1.p1  ORF type:complete len:346 (+),score=37.35 gnl/TRDRNA2_/TRDRNA2_43666_c0_seq1:82-1119(+)
MATTLPFHQHEVRVEEETRQPAQNMSERQQARQESTIRIAPFRRRRSRQEVASHPEIPCDETWDADSTDRDTDDEHESRSSAQHPDTWGSTSRRPHRVAFRWYNDRWASVFRTVANDGEDRSLPPRPRLADRFFAEAAVGAADADRSWPPLTFDISRRQRPQGASVRPFRVRRQEGHYDEANPINDSDDDSTDRNTFMMPDEDQRRESRPYPFWDYSYNPRSSSSDDEFERHSRNSFRLADLDDPDDGDRPSFTDRAFARPRYGWADQLLWAHGLTAFDLDIEASTAASRQPRAEPDAEPPARFEPEEPVEPEVEPHVKRSDVEPDEEPVSPADFSLRSARRHTW